MIAKEILPKSAPEEQASFSKVCVSRVRNGPRVRQARESPLITAEHIINREIPVLHPQDAPADALSLMDQFRVADLPVVEGKRFLGMVSETSLSGADRIGIQSGPLKNGIPLNRVKPQDHILDVLRTASTSHLTVIPVVGDEDQYMGAITLEDLVEHMSLLQGAGQPGGIIVLEMNSKDYSLQQIARIVEENDAKILSTSMHEPEPGIVELHLKVNQPDLNPILQSLNRFNYAVKASYQEPEYTENLQKRYDELMRFLNI